MTKQVVRHGRPVIDIDAKAVARPWLTEHAHASATDLTTIPSAIPTLLGFVAGYVDSCSFLAFNGLFVAAVTGSFVVAGSELVANNNSFLIKVLAIPVFFAAGVLTTAIVRALGTRNRRALVATLALEAALLAGLAWAGLLAASTSATALAALFAVAAMGVQSALARLLLGRYGSTILMTINITQLSIDLTDVVFPRHRDQRNAPDATTAESCVLPRGRLARTSLIIFGFLTGTAAGALAYASIGLICVVFAICILAALAIWAFQRQSHT